MNEFFVNLTASRNNYIMKSFESLTPPQLRRAADIKEKVQSLNNELNRIFGGSITAGTAAPKGSQVKSKMSPAAKAKLSAKLKAYWAKRRAAKKR